MKKKNEVFPFAGIISFLFALTALYSGDESALPRISEEASYQYNFQIAITILIAFLFYRLALPARRGNLRAATIVLGFLSYFTYLSLNYVIISFLGHQILLTLGFLSLFGLSSLELYGYLVPLDAPEYKDRFPDKGARVIPAFFFLALIPLFCLLSFYYSILYIAPLGGTTTGGIILNILHDFTSADDFLFLMGIYFRIGPMTLPETDVFVILPLCIAAAILLFKRRPAGYVLTPILLVMIAVRSLYALKIVPFLVEMIFRHEELATRLETYHSSGIWKLIVLAIYPWFGKLIPAFGALFALVFFLKGMKTDAVNEQKKTNTVKRPHLPGLTRIL
jgi:hypothetical protein